MFDDLGLTLNAQFFRASEGIGDEAFLRLLDAASENAVEDEMLSSEFRVEVRHDQEEFRFRYSLRIFFTDRPVYFLPESDYRDRVCAFILVLEIDEHVVVLKRGVSNISSALERLALPLAANELTATLDSDVAFQRLSVRNMTVSDAALRARSYEAASLEGLLSLHAAGRSIPYFIRVRGRDGISSLSLSTSRLFDASERLSAMDVAAWARGKIAQFSVSSQPRFLSAFAKNVELRNVLARSRPIAILIEAGALLDFMESDEISDLFVIEGGARRFLTERARQRILRSLEKVYEIDDSDQVVGIRAKLKRNKASLTFTSRILQRIHLEYEGREMTMQAFIIKQQLYSICFDDPSYMYFMGRCYQDTSGISEVDSLLRMLKQKPDLVAATSEKGVLRTATRNFDSSSVFGIVEQIHAADDFVFCDDLGDEWADHIAFDGSVPSITFIHSKHGKESTSASQLHDVVSQGIKNLGNMFFDMRTFKAKYNNKLRRSYAGTRIQRKRQGGDQASLDGVLDTVLRSYRVQRRCVLACDFLSRAEIVREFEKIKAGRRVRGHVVQLLWILSSFAHATKEMSVEPRIYCLP